VQADPKLVAAAEIAPAATDRDAHSHARVSKEALAAARLGGIGYHPRCCRGTAASRRWNGPSGKATRSPAAASTISPTAWMPAHRRQEWCFVRKGETARELWERALAPLGQKLLAEVIDHAKRTAACRPSRRRAICHPGAEPVGVDIPLPQRPPC